MIILLDVDGNFREYRNLSRSVKMQILSQIVAGDIGYFSNIDYDIRSFTGSQIMEEAEQEE